MSEEKQKVKIKKNSDEIPVEDIKEILQVVTDEVPRLIQSLFSSLYSAETADQYAKGIATIYRTLTEQGLPEDMVEKLVLRYAASIDVLGSALKGINIPKDISKREEDEED